MDGCRFKPQKYQLIGIRILRNEIRDYVILVSISKVTTDASFSRKSTGPLAHKALVYSSI